MFRLCSFESRKQAEMRSLIERAGAEATLVTSMQEVPLSDNASVLHFAEQLHDGQVDMVVFMTGVGARTLEDVLRTNGDFDAFCGKLRTIPVIARGPKPTVVLRDWQVPPDHRVPEPNTWRELVALIDDVDLPVKGKSIAIQEYGVANSQLLAALEQRGARVLPVRVYRWKLPDDTSAIRDAIHATVSQQFDAMLFTSANQARNVVTVADDEGLKDAWISAANSAVVASIGPTCSETLRELGLVVSLEASPPKMGALVRSVMMSLRSKG